MCGICGIFNYKSSQQIQLETLKKMSTVLAHRGPDGEGFYLDENVGLGFKRLSIVDLATGDQPIRNEDESIILICNGEIFNHMIMRQDLINKGHKFKTQSDCEVLVHLYEEHGEKIFNYIDGQFALCIYDKNRRVFLLGRDHFGVAPLFYTVIAGQLIFASEIKSLLEYDQVPRVVNLTGLDQVLSLPGIVSPQTMFAKIESLLPGHALIIKNDNISTFQYWDAYYPVEGEISYHSDEDYYLEQLEDLLIKAVKKRLMADVKVGAYLSGGLDSSLITGIIKSIILKPGTTVSMTFADDFFSEKTYQDIMVDFLKTEHHQILFQTTDVLDNLRKAIEHCECPLKESYNTASLALSKKARDVKLKVVLTGEGADELFAGYPSYKFDVLRRKRPETTSSQSLVDKDNRVKLWGDENFFYEKDFSQLALTKEKLFSKQIQAQYSEYNFINFGLVDPKKVKGRHPIHQRSYLDLKLRIADHLISDHGDRMLFANSVEGRYPFLDKDLVEYVTTIPPDLKLNGFEEKYILKKLAYKYIPEEIITREKFGFSAPGSPHFLQQKVQWVQDLLSFETIKRQGYFNPDYVAELKDKYSTPGFMLNIPYEEDQLMPIITFGLFKEIFKLPDL